MFVFSLPDRRLKCSFHCRVYFMFLFHNDEPPHISVNSECKDRKNIPLNQKIKHRFCQKIASWRFHSTLIVHRQTHVCIWRHFPFVVFHGIQFRREKLWLLFRHDQFFVLSCRSNVSNTESTLPITSSSEMFFKHG